MNRNTKIAAAVAAALGLTALGASAFAQSGGPAGAPEMRQTAAMGWMDGRDGHRGFGRHHRGMRGGMMRGGMMGAGPMLELFDGDEDGSLTQDEIDAGITAQIEAADANGDGAIDLAEFETIWMTLTERPRVRAFQGLDPDGDASVTREEIDRRFGGIVARMDRNGDGAVGPDDRGRRGGPRRGFEARPDVQPDETPAEPQ